MRRKKKSARYQIAGVAALICLLSAIGTAQTKSEKQKIVPGPKRSVAIASFDIKIGVSAPSGFSIGAGFGGASAQGASSFGTISIPNAAEFSAGLSEELITALMDSKAFWVIDPPATNTVGLNPPNAQPPVPTEPDLPSYFLKAVLTDVTCRQRSAGGSFGIITGGQGQFENKVTLDVRLVDPVSGLVTESVKATGKKTSKSSMFGLAKYEGGSIYYPGTKVLDLTFTDFESSSLGEACRLALQDAASKLAERIANRPWESRILKIVKSDTDHDVYLNAPGDCGLRVGDVLELGIYGDDLTDPKTSRVVGKAKPSMVGKLEVVSTETDTILCRPLGSLPSDLDLANPKLFARLQKTPKGLVDPHQLREVNTHE